MAARRVVSNSFAPARRLDRPAPAFVADRSSPADSIRCRVPALGQEGNDQADREDGGPPRRPERRYGRIEDPLIRLGGLGAIALSADAFAWLYQLIHAAPGSDGTLGQYLVATIGFLCGSAGSGLLVLGRHVHDRIELSDRWRPRR